MAWLQDCARRESVFHSPISHCIILQPRSLLPFGHSEQLESSSIVNKRKLISQERSLSSVDRCVRRISLCINELYSFKVKVGPISKAGSRKYKPRGCQTKNVAYFFKNSFC